MARLWDVDVQGSDRADPHLPWRERRREGRGRAILQKRMLGNRPVTHKLTQ